MFRPYGGEYRVDGDHQADLYAVGVSVGMSIKFSLDKILHQIKIRARFGCFMAKKMT